MGSFRMNVQDNMSSELDFIIQKCFVLQFHLHSLKNVGEWAPMMLNEDSIETLQNKEISKPRKSHNLTFNPRAIRMWASTQSLKLHHQQLGGNWALFSVLYILLVFHPSSLFIAENFQFTSPTEPMKFHVENNVSADVSNLSISSGVWKTTFLLALMWSSFGLVKSYSLAVILVFPSTALTWLTSGSEVYNSKSLIHSWHKKGINNQQHTEHQRQMEVESRAIMFNFMETTWMMVWFLYLFFSYIRYIIVEVEKSVSQQISSFPAREALNNSTKLLYLVTLCEICFSSADCRRCVLKVSRVSNVLIPSTSLHVTSRERIEISSNNSSKSDPFFLGTFTRHHVVSHQCHSTPFTHALTQYSLDIQFSQLECDTPRPPVYDAETIFLLHVKYL